MEDKNIVLRVHEIATKYSLGNSESEKGLTLYEELSAIERTLKGASKVNNEFQKTINILLKAMGITIEEAMELVELRQES